MLYKVHSGFLTWCTTPPWYLFALSHWASHPAVSAFVLSWKQQCDRSWVGVRDELWGNGQGFFLWIFYLFIFFTAGGAEERCLKQGVDEKLRGLWHGISAARVFTPSQLQGMLSLCRWADLKSAIPSICAESRPHLECAGFLVLLILCYPESTGLVIKELLQWRGVLSDVS